MGSRDWRSSERGHTQWLGQHRLKSPKLAASLVSRANISPSDLVIEVGAGGGILTTELARLAAQVLAVELDPALAGILVERFSNHHNVHIIAGDFLDLPVPARPFRVFGSIPFGSTTRILRHLLDPTTGILRADLIVERGVAIKRARPARGKLLNVCWAPWWEFSMGRRIAARSFDPAPTVDAALLSISKRKKPLMPEHDKPAFAHFVRSTFGASELKSAMAPFLSARRFKSLSTELGFPADAGGPQLDAHQWIALYKTARPGLDPGSTP